MGRVVIRPTSQKPSRRERRKARQMTEDFNRYLEQTQPPPIDLANLDQGGFQGVRIDENGNLRAMTQAEVDLAMPSHSTPIPRDPLLEFLLLEFLQIEKPR